MEAWETQNNQNNTEGEEKRYRTLSPKIQPQYLCVTSQKGGQITENRYAEIDPHKYSQPIFHRKAKAIQWKKDSLFIKQCWNNWISTCKEKKLI